MLRLGVDHDRSRPFMPQIFDSLAPEFRRDLLQVDSRNGKRIERAVSRRHVVFLGKAWTHAKNEPGTCEQ